jgi:hypothetical protein
MAWVWIVLVGMFVMFVVALLSRVRAHIVYTREAQDDQFYIQIRALFGAIRYRHSLPTINFEGIKQGVSLSKEKITNIPTPDTKDQITLDGKDIVHRHKKFKELLSHVLGFHHWLVSTLKRTHCSQISWITNVGLDDAPETAITTGVIWGLKTSILGVLFNHIKLEAQPHLAVVPHYDHPQFKTHFDCIMMIRLGHAMLAGLHLLVRIYKVKGGIRTWQKNILSEA